MTNAATTASSHKEDISHHGSKSTLSILKHSRAESAGLGDFYDKVWDQITGVKPYYGILDCPMRFILRIVIIVVGSIFLNDCKAEPMLPIYLIVHGVVGLSIQIIEEIAGSLSMKNNATWRKVTIYCTNLMAIFLSCWFIAGCVWVFRMPLPNMTRIPDNATEILDLMMSTTTNNVLNDQLASMNNTMVAFLSPEKHCAFPVYGLAVWVVLSLLLLDIGGCFVIVVVTTFILYFLPEVKNVRNMALLQMSNLS